MLTETFLPNRPLVRWQTESVWTWQEDTAFRMSARVFSMKNKYALISILTLLALLCASLSFSGCLTECGSDARQARAMRRMSPQQRREAFARMSPEEQLDIYLAAAGGEPGYNFSEEVGANWKSVLPVLLRRLSTQAGSAERIQLLWLLATISEHYCSLKDRKDVLDIASQVVSRMEEPSKHYAEEPLRRITHPTRQLSPCQ
jgi:hypothetical protein